MIVLDLHGHLHSDWDYGCFGLGVSGVFFLFLLIYTVLQWHLDLSGC